MKNHHIISSLGVMLALTSSCSGETPAPADPLTSRQLPEEVRADATLVVAGNNAFAFDIYRELKVEEGNLFFSPFSISTAFAMTYAGARGETEAEIARVFHFTGRQERLHPVYRELLASLDRGAAFEGYRLNVANRLWGEKNFQFLDEYKGLTREQYGAELETVDFSVDPEAARETVNGWVEEKTEKRINDLFPPGSITTDTRLILANAIYFKGNWDTQFDPQKTRDAAFHVSSSRQVTVPMMHIKEAFRIGSHEGVQLLELPYAGRDLSMILLLPEAVDGLPALEERLTGEALDAWTQAAHEMSIDVYLPRFSMTSSFSLKDKLAAMGMPAAFTDAADFSGMNGTGGLYIQSAFHKAFVNVNEEGTEAAAATGVGVGVTSLPPSFRADHPFLFLIRDNVTGSILFLGRVLDPTA